MTGFSVAIALVAVLSKGDSMDRLVEVGLSRSSRLEAARARVAAATAQRSEALTALRPELRLNASGTALDRTQSSNLGPVQITGAKQWQGRVALDASIAIDVTGDLRGLVRIADLGVQSASLALKVAHNELVRDIHLSALQVVQAEQILETALAALNNAKDRQATITKLLDNGVGTRFDVLRAQTEVADTAQRVTAARNRVEVARANLARILEIPGEQIGTVAIPKTWDKQIHGPDGEHSRPELAQARLAVQAAELGVRLSGREARPTLQAGITSYALANPGTFEPKRGVSAASLVLSIPIVERGRARAQGQEARADLAAAKANKRLLEEAIRFEIAEAQARYADASERIGVAERALEQAEEQYRIAKRRLDAGITQGNLSPLLELSDSQTALTQARNNLTNARIDLAVARVLIAFALGEEIHP